ncbi:uncharacterized protein BCR38DRAFT_390086 [Pseudomassariella vexata]|uniref:Cupin type-2 domain-containing protein n=1 Tax=Pseudomassariella vexata TaxID=1141098 RepID=A0A1Y2E4G7_9PEZI|nr:uncharacterized protein BCR38DRAFT_390086 [Pseudomassariella vexata]ORY66409.1 hypothetical protein BCR38DRAFT_390086 [Pseudomassariella vexata]
MSTRPTGHKPNDLRQINRFITDHNDIGEAVFSTALPELLPGKKQYNDAVFSLGYCTNERPVTLAGNKDLNSYAAYLKDPQGIVVPGGTVARYVDMAPDSISPMHRTVSLDYGVVLEGEIELVLDSGEVRRLMRGDLAVQRGTMHAWRNPSKTEWARMLYFLQESHTVEVSGGRKLGEDYGDMEGVKASGN